jgi:hypothetical protein
MRAKAVRQAEAVYGASVVVMVAMAVVAWPSTVASVGTTGAFLANALVIGLTLLFLLLATRRRSVVALWLLAALTAIGVGGFLWQVASGVLSTGLMGVLTTVQTATAVVAVVLLFRPTARAWFAHEPAPVEDVS